MNLINLIMPSLFLLLFSMYLFSPNVSTSDPEDSARKLIINIQKNNISRQLQDRTLLKFTDGEQIRLTCTFQCDKCNEGDKYSLQFDLHKHHDKKVTVSTTARIPHTFTLHRNNTEIVCKAIDQHGNGTGHLPSPVRVRLQYVLRPHEAPEHTVKLSSPTISPAYFKDTGETSALFTCTAHRKGIAVLSWLQMKGSDHIILKTVSPHNYTINILYDTLNKTLTESDRDTKLFCAARYILEGPRLSNRMMSNMIKLSFNRTIESALPQETWVLSFKQWMAIIGAIIVTALIVVIILVAVILKYKRKVKEYERDELIRNRPALMPPPTEDVYEQVYGHGAGLKRPKIRPTEKLH